MHEPELTPATTARTLPTIREIAGSFTVQDAVLLAYLAALEVLLLGAPATAVRARCLKSVGALAAVVVLAVVVARLVPRVPDAVRGVVYRVALVGALVGSYLLLRDIVPLVRTDAVDDTLLAIDVRLLGFEPTLALEALNRRPIVEWFSFFYFAYYFVILAFVAGVTFVASAVRRTTEFAIGTFLVYGLGHLGYMAVPGEGPHAVLAATFHGPVDGGFFWKLVWNAYATSSAAKDVFPSLHVGAPAWFTLYALGRARGDRRWRWAAAAAAFVTSQIAFATLLLRWHYAIDLVAGVGLAAFAAVVAPRLAHWEERVRAARGLPPVWPGAIVTPP